MNKYLLATLALATVGTAVACNETIENCVDVEDIMEITNTTLAIPILTHIHQIHINCWNFTCQVTENFFNGSNFFLN